MAERAAADTACARYSAIAPTSASRRASSVRAGSCVDASRSARPRRREHRSVSTNSGRAIRPAARRRDALNRLGEGSSGASTAPSGFMMLEHESAACPQSAPLFGKYSRQHAIASIGCCEYRQRASGSRCPCRSCSPRIGSLTRMRLQLERQQVAARSGRRRSGPARPLARKRAELHVIARRVGERAQVKRHAVVEPVRPTSHFAPRARRRHAAASPARLLRFRRHRRLRSRSGNCSRASARSRHRPRYPAACRAAAAARPISSKASSSFSRSKRARHRAQPDAQPKSPPIRRIMSTKPGKLVAMKAVSSTRTGCSLASPITSADIAMR